MPPWKLKYIMHGLLRYILLPSQSSEFEKNYLVRVNRVALWFFVAHLPVFTLIAYFNSTGPKLAIGLTSAVLIGPLMAMRFLQSQRSVSVIMGITAMLMGGLLVHFGQGPVQIEMHFYFFVLLALLAVYANPLVIVVAALTVAVHHLVLWYVLPASVFNYDAPVWVVGVHALFVVLEAVAACFIARNFFDNVVELEQRIQERTLLLTETNSKLSREIAERTRAQQELAKAHRDLIEAARRAGMAEIATGVLHNVGNALNSVTVSVSTMSNQLQESRIAQLGSTVALFDEHSDNLANFITSHEKGRLVPRFLRVLSEHLQEDQENLRQEVAALTNSVDHIKAIISTQQSYAGYGGMVEPVDVNDLLDDAIELNMASYHKHGIQVIKDYGDLPTVLLDKQRLLQIVINLVKNAKEALYDQADGKRQLTIRTQADEDRLTIEVTDNGVGIELQNLDKIFSHGFTTKASGHGFGLHSCANAATEMDGSLKVTSPGTMQGATFVLNLPLTAAAVPNCVG
jgi:signal transduction histidine kinase